MTAATGHLIDSFSGPYRFLSNFYPCIVRYEGYAYPSVEHGYQAAKTLDLEKRQRFQDAGITAGVAKRWGRRLKLRPDWESVKEAVMYELLVDKFQRDPNLRNQLLQTGRAKLVEGNDWYDTYWGVCNGVGKNRLGVLLMEVRKQLIRAGHKVSGK